jgi:hypothetical protein
MGNDTIPLFSHNTSFGYTNQKFFGDNVYNKYHNNYQGFYLKAGLLIFKHYSFDLITFRYSARINNTAFINATKTSFSDFCINAAYVFYPEEAITIAPSIFYRSIKGKNQGKFYGSGFGIGAEIKYHIFKHFYINVGTESGKMHFDIKAPSDIQDQFTNAYFVNFYAGLGLRLY